MIRADSMYVTAVHSVQFDEYFNLEVRKPSLWSRVLRSESS